MTVLGFAGLAVAGLLLGWALGGSRPSPMIAPLAFLLPAAPAVCVFTTSGAQQVLGGSGLALAFGALVAMVLRLDREAADDDVRVRWQEFEWQFRRYVEAAADHPGA